MSRMWLRILMREHVHRRNTDCKIIILDEATFTFDHQSEWKVVTKRKVLEAIPIKHTL